MTSAAPAEPKIYHITHIDRLPSIVLEEYLLCDAEIDKRASTGPKIGISAIKKRRLDELTLNSHSGLFVGNCVPFYFCPRSVMLYLIHCGNHPDLRYRSGQGDIVHLEADLQQTVNWARTKNLRWAFTLGNAGARYFEDRCDLTQLDEINWTAVNARDWQHCKDGKQAEFLVEHHFPWHLVVRVGVCSLAVSRQVSAVLRASSHKPLIEICKDWYY